VAAIAPKPWLFGLEIHAIDTPADGRIRIECLTFTDGSRAFRFAEANEKRGWATWIAAEPVL
jgi:hypothetical protein